MKIMHTLVRKLEVGDKVLLKDLPINSKYTLYDRSGRYPPPEWCWVKVGHHEMDLECHYEPERYPNDPWTGKIYCDWQDRAVIYLGMFIT